MDEVNNVLEPSVGKGNLVRCVAKKVRRSRYGYGRKMEVDCVEIDPYLRSIFMYEFGGQRKAEYRDRLKVLEAKREYDYEARAYRKLSEEEAAEYKQLEYERELLDRVETRVVHDNFLTFDTRKHYSLIVMNPPFADGDAHLLHAIQMQERSGGKIRCILNAETILNPCTDRRKLLKKKLEEHGAEVKIVEDAFSFAERETDVTVAVIRIAIPAPERESEIYERLRKAAEIEETPPEDITDMTVTDFFAQIVSRFNVEVDAGLELIREYDSMKRYMLTSFDKEHSFGFTTLTLCVGEPGRTSRGQTPVVNDYIRLVRSKYWQALLSNKEFIGKLTSNLQEKYYNMVSELADYDFTLYNIHQISVQMNAEMGKGVEETIVALFDKMTEEHSWYPECAKNIHYFNGWKTNKVHKINSKVILPTYGMFSSYSWDKDTFCLCTAESTISDIEKVFEYLDGNMTANVDLHGVLQSAHDEGRTKNIQCKFFSVTLYKKGTMHIKFHNQELVDRFNIYCARKKAWLPPNYGRTTYGEMTSEEKAVVDGFHGDGSAGAGANAYQKILARKDYYLGEPTREVPLLASAT